MGVANDRSIAWAVAKYLGAEGAELALSHFPDAMGNSRMSGRVRRLAESVGSRLVLPCDVGRDEDVEALFAAAREAYGTIDFLVHSIAYAPIDELRRATLDASRSGFRTAMDISVYSLIAATRAAAPLMPHGGAVVTLTYYGGEKVISGYNLMGVCKAALQSAVQYLAHDLGHRNIRVNALSAGPMRTLAASALGGLEEMRAAHARIAPLARNVEGAELGKAAAYLVSDLSSATTGEVLHVDCGYNTMGSPAVRLAC